MTMLLQTAEQSLPLPLCLAAESPMVDAGNPAAILNAARQLRGRAPDADVHLAAFTRLVALDAASTTALSYLLAGLMDDDEDGEHV